MVRLGFALGDSSGGYKTPSLKGLYWRAPYLHDGGVAVGPRQEKGITGTLLRGIHPDPIHSLTALLYKNLRQQVIEAGSQDLRNLHIQGIGHEYWVDPATGFSKEEQQALVQYLLHPILWAPLLERFFHGIPGVTGRMDLRVLKETASKGRTETG